MSETNSLTNFRTASANVFYHFEGPVVSIDQEGSEDKKRPIKFTVQIEGTDNRGQIMTWDYGLLSLIKTAKEEEKICEFDANTKVYNGELGFYLKAIRKSTVKTAMDLKNFLKPKTSIGYKDFFEQIIQNIKNEEYKKLLTKLILENENFFTWPAARSVHHAFDGGLAMHTYGVYNTAIAIANNYTNDRRISIDYDLLIAGALLHDIGKLAEYTQDHQISYEGEFLSHLVLGIEMIDDALRELEIDSHQPGFIKLRHLIASHHGKLEFGSPNLPKLIEAEILCMADNSDATMEGIAEAMNLTEEGTISKPIKAADGHSIMKWGE